MDEVRKLDEEFKAGLVAIRPYLSGLNAEQVKLCREWVGKLHDCVEPRKLRNIYLERLTSQVKNQRLLPPFNEQPPGGPLFFTGGTEVKSTSTWSECWSDSIPSSDGSGDQENRDHQRNPCKINRCESPKSWHELTNRKNTKFLIHQSQQDPPQPVQCSSSILLGQGDNNVEGVSASPENSILEARINSLLDCLGTMKSANASLKSEVEWHKNASERYLKNYDEVSGGVLALTEKIAELQKVNDVLRETHLSVVGDYKKAVNDTVKHLSDRLSDASDRNRKVEAQINKIRNTFRSTFLDRIKKLEEQKNLEMHKMKVERLREKEENLNEIERLKEQLSRKDSELAELKKVMKKQCTHIEDEMQQIKEEMNNSYNQAEAEHKHKIICLKKKIRKLEQKNEKLNREFDRRLWYSKKDYDFQMKSLTLQMGGQRSDLSREIEGVINSLEEKYRILLSQTENHYRSQRQLDLKRIRELERQLSHL